MKKIGVCFIGVFLVIIFKLFYSSDLFVNSLSDEVLVNYNGNNLLVSIDGNISTALPTEGNYYLTDYVCTSPNTVITWNNASLELNVTNGKNGGGVSCELTFKSNPLLSEMPVGSYVSYVGSGGVVGTTDVTCKNNGEVSSNVMSEATEASNSCSGQNAREDLETADSETYGYCYNADHKYYVTGWRIAYIKNNKAMIVSAGSPECYNRTSSIENETYIKKANALALKYCNTNFVDGNCMCEDVDADGLCDSASTDAWAINDVDFYYVTKAISGYGKRLTSFSSDLGDSGGVMNTDYCYSDDVTNTAFKECGYNNDLLDNGGLYWFAARDGLASMNTAENGVVWWPTYRHVGATSEEYAYGIRPIISISSAVYVTGGVGTMDDPYTIAN